MNEMRNQNRQVFVAYAYNLYDQRDYRKVYSDLETAYNVKFIFTDEKITNMHILQKIISYINSSDFSLFDISGWNPNVTLELGIAISSKEDWYICFNPDKTQLNEVPSDIRGIDRIQYNSFSELADRLTVLLEQRYPKNQRVRLEDYITTMQEDVIRLLKNQSGLMMSEIAELLNVNIKMAQVIVNPMIGTQIEVKGQRRGAKYSLRQ